MNNYNGLYRYDIGDVVEVLGFYEQTPLIVFRHQVRGLLSSTTEKTTEFHVTQVMRQLQQDFNLSLENFCVTLSERKVPAHYWINIELIPGHQLKDSMAFLTQFDRQLKAIHTSYEVKRRDQVPLPRLQQMIQRGIPESQLKFPHISEDRQLLAGLIVEQEVRMAEEMVIESLDDHFIKCLRVRIRRDLNHP